MPEARSAKLTVLVGHISSYGKASCDRNALGVLLPRPDAVAGQGGIVLNGFPVPFKRDRAAVPRLAPTHPVRGQHAAGPPVDLLVASTGKLAALGVHAHHTELPIKEEARLIAIQSLVQPVGLPHDAIPVRHCERSRQLQLHLIAAAVERCNERIHFLAHTARACAARHGHHPKECRDRQEDEARVPHGQGSKPSRTA